MKVNHITNQRDGGLVQGNIMEFIYTTAEKTRLDQFTFLRESMNDMDAGPKRLH